MNRVFHLAIDAGDLETATQWYQAALGCGLGADAEAGRYQDIDFWGNELTLHQSEPRTAVDGDWHDVEMGRVPVPHLGIHLTEADWQRVVDTCTEFYPTHVILKPFVRYAGKPTEQRTFFVRDTNYNVLEIKFLKANQ